jgi:hypothetical protein
MFYHLTPYHSDIAQISLVMKYYCCIRLDNMSLANANPWGKKKSSNISCFCPLKNNSHCADKELIHQCVLGVYKVILRQDCIHLDCKEEIA